MNKLFIKDLFKYKYSIYLIGLLSIFSVTMVVIIPLIIGWAVDLAGVEGYIDFNRLYFYVFLIMLFALISSIFTYLITILATSISYKVIVDLRQKTFAKIHSLPLSYLDTQPKGKINSLIVNDLQLIIDGLTSILNILITSVLTIIFSGITMIILNSLIGSIVVVISVLSLYLTKLIAKKARFYFNDSLEKTSMYNAYTAQMLTNKNILTTFNYEKISIDTSTNINKELSKARAQAMFFTSLNGPISRFISNMTYLSVGLIGGLLFIYRPGSISLAIISSMLVYSTVFSRPLANLATIQTQILSCNIAAKRVYSFLENSDDYIKSDDELIISEGNVEFKNVFFSYDKSTPLIQDFNLEVKMGQKIAIVGPTGSGKTTLVNLIMRFYNVNRGQILIDNQDISNYSKDSLRNYIAMVLQDTWLKAASIKENLMYSNNNTTFDDVLKICEELNILKFIENTPNSFDTIISETSSSISQGQRQLLSIARAMLIDSKMVILDEATSNVDTRTEILINKALDKLMKNKTSFVIAHRLKTIMNADNIIVLDKGQIVEIGNHNNLLNKKGFYYELFNSQFKEY